MFKYYFNVYNKILRITIQPRFISILHNTLYKPLQSHYNPPFRNYTTATKWTTPATPHQFTYNKLTPIKTKSLNIWNKVSIYAHTHTHPFATNLFNSKVCDNGWSLPRGFPPLTQASVCSNVSLSGFLIDDRRFVQGKSTGKAAT